MVQGQFDGRILLRNVQLYQLALVLLVLRDMNEGFVQLGSSTTRGHGFVQVHIRSLVIESRRGKGRPGEIHGVGALVPSGDYKFFGDDRMELPKGLEAVAKLMWDRLTVPPSRLDDLANALVDGPWMRFLQQAQGMGPWTA